MADIRVECEHTDHRITTLWVSDSTDGYRIWLPNGLANKLLAMINAPKEFPPTVIES